MSEGPIIGTWQHLISSLHAEWINPVDLVVSLWFPPLAITGEVVGPINPVALTGSQIRFFFAVHVMLRAHRCADDFNRVVASTVDSGLPSARFQSAGQDVHCVGKH